MKIILALIIGFVIGSASAILAMANYQGRKVKDRETELDG